MTALAFIAAAALCLALGTAEIAHRLTLPQAFMLTAGAIESSAPLWAVGVAVLVLSAVIAGRLSRAGARS